MLTSLLIYALVAVIVAGFILATNGQVHLFPREDIDRIHDTKAPRWHTFAFAALWPLAFFFLMFCLLVGKFEYVRER